MLNVDDGAGDFIAGTAPTQVMVGTGGTSTFTVPTADDRVDEADGRITVTVTSGSGYTVGMPSSAPVTVTDDDDPEVSIAAGALVTEGEAVTFTVTASSAPTTNLLVNVSVDEGFGDFISGPAPQMVTIPANTTSATLMVPTVDDSVNELDGRITAMLTSGTGYTVAAPPAHRATVTVRDDDEVEVSIAALTSPVIEGTAAQFIVSASTASASTLTVNVSVVDSGSFLSGTAPTTVTINAGQMSALLRVATEDDTTEEPGGTITATLTSGMDYAVAAAPGNQAMVVVSDNDGTVEPSITITAVNTSVTEGMPVSFTVALSEALTSALTVNVRVIQNGIFLSGTRPTMVTIPAGDTTFLLTMSTAGDSIDELDGTVTVTVTSGMGYMVGMPSSAVVTVTDDDDPVVRIAAGASPVGEGTSVLFEVSTSTVQALQASALTVNVNVADSGDFVSAGETGTRTVTISSGQSRATLTIPTNNDRIDEADGTITAMLTTGSGYTVAADPNDSAMVIVTDNDTAGITVTPTSGLTTTEATAGTATFTVVLDSEPTASVSIGVSSSDTTEGTVSSTTLMFTSTTWNNAQTVTVMGVDDNVDDDDQAYMIELAAAVSTDMNYNNLDPDDVSVSNTDDDVAPPSITLTVLPNTLGEGDSATTVTVTATLDGGTTVSAATTVTLSLGGTATGSGTDYSATAPTITIAAEMATGTATFAITPMEDTMVEGAENIEISGTATGGFSGTVNSATVTLTDNDVADATPPTLSTAVVNGNTLVLTYDETLDGGSVPATSAFSIGGVTTVSVNTVAISGMTVTLTLSSAVTSTDVVTVTYMVPGMNPLQDEAMNNAVALSMRSVTNNTPSSTPLPAPTGVMTSGNAPGALRVSWTAPDPAPTGGYQVQYRSDDGANWLPDPDPEQVARTTHTFTGLAAGEYDARVRSVVGGDTSAWTETGTAEQVDVRTVRIDSEIRINRNGFIPIGCTDSFCTTFNLEILFRGAREPTNRDLSFRLTDVPDHGLLDDTLSGDLHEVGSTVAWADVRDGFWYYNHHGAVIEFLNAMPPSGADEDALMDSFEFEFEGTIYRVDITINQPPAVVASPSEPGPFTARTAATFDVADDFTDPNGDTLTYELGTVSPTPPTGAVTISDGTVTISTAAMPGTYTIPVEAEDAGELSVTHEYVVVVSGVFPTGVTATADTAGELAVSWTAPSTAPSGGYHVQYSSDGGANWLPDPEQAVAMDTTTHVFMDLAAGTYSTRVRAVYSESPSSEWVQGTAVQVDVYELIITDLEVERGGALIFGCHPSGYTYPNCDDPARTVHIDVWFRGAPVIPGIADDLDITFRRAPAHGAVVGAGSSIVAGTVFASLTRIREGEEATGYLHNDRRSPSDADPNAPTDSFDIEIAGVRYTVPVSIVNRAPRIVGTPSAGPYTAGVGGTFRLDSDFTDAFEDTLEFSLGTVTGPMPGAVTLAGSEVTIDTTATAGTYGIPVTVSDGSLETTYTYTVVVNPEPGTNGAPTVVGTPSAGPFTAGTGGTFDVRRDFSDPDSDPLSYALGTVTGPMPGAVTLLDGTSTVTIGTTATAGTYNIPVVATDDDTSSPLSVTHVYQVVVDTVNRTPVVVAEPSVPGPFLAGVEGSFDVSGDFSDPDGDTLTYSLGTVNPASAAVTLATGTSVVTVGTGTTAGDYTVQVTATDGGGLAVTHTYSVEVLATPEVSIRAVTASVTEGTLATFQVVAEPPPSSALTVMLGVDDGAGDFISGTAPTQVMVGTGGTSTFTVPTADDRVDEADGTITATVTAGSGYTVAVAPDNSATVTVTDDDDPEVSITAGATVTEGGDATFTVTASSAPTTNLLVNVSVDEGVGDFISGPAPQMVTIPANMTSATLTVPTVDDSMNEVDGRITATLAPGTGYTVAAPPAHRATVTVSDDDDPVVRITAVTSPVTEGEAALFTVSASSASASALMVNVSVMDSGSFLSGTAPTTVTINAGQMSALLRVATEDDRLDEADGMITATVTTGSGYTVATSPDNSAMVMVNNDDEAGITVTPTSGLTTTEAGAGTATFTVVLDSQPTANVVIGVSSSDTGEGTVSLTSLTFTDSDWDEPQMVTVTGVDDGDDDGTVDYSIELAAATSTDMNYSGEDPADVRVSNVDDDGGIEPTVTITAGAGVTEGEAATFTVMVSPAPTSALTVNVDVEDSGAFASTGAAGTRTVTINSGATSATLTVSTVDDSIDEADGTLTATLTTDTGYTVGTPSSAEVAVTDDDDPEVRIAADASLVDEGTLVSFEVIASMVQASDLVVSFNVVDSGVFAPLSVTGARTVTIFSGQSRATLAIPTNNDRIDEADGTITATLTTGSGYTVAASPDNSVTVMVTDNDVAGITVTPTSGLTTTEAGGTDTFTVVLDTQPTANVVIGVSSSDMGEGTVSPTTLTFTASDWDQPQPVTVTGVDDSDDDGTVSYTIELAAPTSSADTNYSVVDPADVSVSNADDDGDIESTVTITAGGGVTEGGDVTFTVAAAPAPTSDLTVSVNVVDSGVFTLSSATGARTVTINSGVSRATLTVSTVADRIDEMDGTITATLTPDTGYRVGMPSSADVVVMDDDVAGVTVTPTSGLTTTEAGAGTATFTVVLDSEPTASVVIGVSSSNEDEGMVSTDTLTFTNTDWDNAKTVTVTGVNDNVDDGNQTYTIELAATSTDTNYNSLDPVNVSVSNVDNDAAPTSITLTVRPNTLGEGDSATNVTVTATFDGGTTVSAATTVTLSLGGTAVSGTDYSATAPPITIPAETATGTATFAITPMEDSDGEGNENIVVSGTATGGFSGTVNSATVTLTDNDVVDAMAPTFVSAAVNGNLLVLTYDEALDEDSVPATSAFMIRGPSVTVDAVAISGSMVTLTLSAAVSATDVAAVTYTVPDMNPLRDVAGNAAVALLTNNVADATAPTFVSAAVNGDMLVLTYSEALDAASTPAASAFMLGGTAATVSMVAISGTMVTLTLSSTVTSTDVVTVTYTVGANPLRDTAMNNAAALTTPQPVMNNTPAPTFPSPPTGVMTFNSAAGALTVFWTAPVPASTGGYHVQYSSDGSGNWLPADPGQAVAAGTTTHVFTGLAAGMYHARVRSVGTVNSDWVETGTAVRVDVRRTIRIDSEIRVNRNDVVPLGCTDILACAMFNLEVLFRGVQDSTPGLGFLVTDAPDHGHLDDNFTLKGAGSTVDWEAAQDGFLFYNHHEATSHLSNSPPPPPGADVDALMDSFEFEFEGTIYTVNITINQPPVVVASPSEPGPFMSGTAVTFGVADDFTDPNGDMLTYALKDDEDDMVTGPTPTAVTISESGTVTIDATATAGTYTIPVEASDSGDYERHSLSVTHTYTVVVSGSAPTGVTATADAAGELAVSWTAPDPAPSGGYHVQYSSDGGANWLPDPEQVVAAATDPLMHTFEDLVAGTYSTRVRAVYGAADASAWVQGTAVQVDVYELIIKDLEVERGGDIGLGCSLGRIPFGRYTYPNCITLLGLLLVLTSSSEAVRSLIP